MIKSNNQKNYSRALNYQKSNIKYK